MTTDKQQVNARLSAQARAVLAAIHERTGTNRTAIIEFALAFLLAGLDGGWISEEQIGPKGKPIYTAYTSEYQKTAFEEQE